MTRPKSRRKLDREERARACARLHLESAAARSKELGGRVRDVTLPRTALASLLAQAEDGARIGARLEAFAERLEREVR